MSHRVMGVLLSVAMEGLAETGLAQDQRAICVKSWVRGRNISGEGLSWGRKALWMVCGE